MSQRLWQFSSIMATAVTMSAAFAHLMELPAKMHYDRTLYVKLHRTLYWNFGRFGGPAEMFAVLSTAVLAWRARTRNSKTFPLTAAAAGCFAAAHATFWAFVNPVNTTMVNWPMDAIPTDWTRWRDQWEYAHAARAFLTTVGFGALVYSALQEADQHDSVNLSRARR
jgi:hypothetical protein